MLPQEVDTGLWSNNSSSVSLHDHRPASFLDSLSDLSVKDILDMYKHDAELLKHILLAKAEEDKRRAAEEVRRAEEARLHTKYLELGWGSPRRISDPSFFTNEFLSGSLGSLAVSSSDAVGAEWLPIPNGMAPSFSPMATSTSQFDQTPPSPTTSFYRPPSPSTNTPSFADMTSVTSSPEPSYEPSKLTNESTTSLATLEDPHHHHHYATLGTSLEDPAMMHHAAASVSPPSSYMASAAAPMIQEPTTAKEDTTSSVSASSSFKSACKRTLSRTRSQRRPVVMTGKKKNRSSTMEPTGGVPINGMGGKTSILTLSPATVSVESLPTSTLNSTTTTTTATQKDDAPLDHRKVMEALRAKLRRSSNPPSAKDQQASSTTSNPIQYASLWSEDDPPPQPMSPQGMLLLDLKNPRKVFTNNTKRTSLNPRVAVLRRPRPFTSAHNHCDASKDSIAAKDPAKDSIASK